MIPPKKPEPPDIEVFRDYQSTPRTRKTMKTDAELRREEVLVLLAACIGGIVLTCATVWFLHWSGRW